MARPLPGASRARLLLLVAALCGALPSCSNNGPGGRRPHVVVVVVDTLRADLVSDPYGLADTPHLDELIAGSKGFTHAVAHAPLTLPSHTSLFSGRLPHEAGVLNNAVPVPTTVELLPEWLERYGYESRAVISMGTLNPVKQAPSLARGFSHYDIDYHNLDDAERVLERVRASLDARDEDRPLFLFAHFADPHAPYRDHDDVPSEVVLTAGEAELARLDTSMAPHWSEDLELEAGTFRLRYDFADLGEVRMLFLRPAAGGPHLPVNWEVGRRRAGANEVVVSWEVPEDGSWRLSTWVSDVTYVEQVQQRYPREVEHVDRVLGALVEELEARGMWQDTVFVFTSDHGEALGERGRIGHPWSLYEDQVRVPLLLRTPESHPFHEELQAVPTDALIGLRNLAPTLLQLCGLPGLPGTTGTSILDAVGSPVLSEVYPPESPLEHLSLRSPDHKLVWTPAEDAWELYDLRADPAEQRDLFADRGGEFAEWQALLRSVFERSRAALRGETDEEAGAMLDALGY